MEQLTDPTLFVLNYPFSHAEILDFHLPRRISLDYDQNSYLMDTPLLVALLNEVISLVDFELGTGFSILDEDRPGVEPIHPRLLPTELRNLRDNDPRLPFFYRVKLSIIIEELTKLIGRLIPTLLLVQFRYLTAEWFQIPIKRNEHIFLKVRKQVLRTGSSEYRLLADMMDELSREIQNQPDTSTILTNQFVTEDDTFFLMPQYRHDRKIPDLTIIFDSIWANYQEMK